MPCHLMSCRNEQLKAEEASFRQAREDLLQDLEKRVKLAKTALATASTALKKQERLSKVNMQARRKNNRLSLRLGVRCEIPIGATCGENIILELLVVHTK